MSSLSLSKTCFTPLLGNSHWKTSMDNKVCPESKPVTLLYKGEAKKYNEIIGGMSTQTYIFNQGDNSFAMGIHSVGKYCNVFTIVQTEHPRLFIIEGDTGTALDLFQIKISAADVDIITQFNSKLMYVMRNMKGQLDNMFHIFQEERCRLEILQLRQLQTIAYHSPNQFAYDYYGRPGYTARISGEIIYITQCKATSVSYLPMPNKCYQEIPVSYDNKTYFIQPRTKLLTQIGTELKCNPITRPVFRLEDGWYTTAADSMIRVAAPEELAPSESKRWEFIIPKDILTSGTYPKEALDDYHRSLSIPSSSPKTVRII